MLLTFDIGNANVKLGAFQDEGLIATWRLATDTRRTADEYASLLRSLMLMHGVESSSVRGVALCSVVPPLTAVFEEVCRRHFDAAPLVVGPEINTGVRVHYEPPGDVGADRIVAAAAAYRMYGGPAIIVELGTATVFDAVTADGDYLGGAIHPGLQVSAEALFTSTSQLRRVRLMDPERAIGRNTVMAIQSGIVLGHVGLVEGMVRRFQEELGRAARVVGTGGLVHLIAPRTDVFTIVNEDLILQGLRLVYEMNRPRS